MLGNCEYINDLKGDDEISKSNSELTGASSLTLESDAQDSKCLSKSSIFCKLQHEIMQ